MNDLLGGMEHDMAQRRNSGHNIRGQLRGEARNQHSRFRYHRPATQDGQAEITGTTLLSSVTYLC